MKKVNRIIGILLSIIMMFSVVTVTDISTVTAKAEETFSITSPTSNQVVAAGYIDITWNAATTSTVKNYEVYVDDAKVATTTSTTCEFYTTKVKLFDAYVKAIFTNGKSQNTAKVTFGVSKKGLGLATDMGARLDLKDMGVAWYYNWGTGPSRGTQYQGIEYVPMVWRERNANNFRNTVQTFKNQGYKYVLTFNEPDLKGQCDMPVNDVYNVWKGINGMTGIRISSPVTALWPQASTNWFQPFMTRVDENGDYQPDFISIHCYPDNYGGAGMAKWFVKEVVDWTWEKYHLPIWITEFSTAGQYITATGGNGTKEFWEAVMPELDKREYVERYAAFGFNDSKTGLWAYYTGSLTPAGEVYKAQGNPTSYVAPGDDSGNNVTSNNNTTTKKVKKPVKAKIKSLKNVKKKKIKVSIKKIKGAAGYQVRWSDSKKFNGYWQKTVRITKCTLKRLDKNTRYYVKVRAYVKNGKKKLYGPWSNRKSVKVKK